MYSIAYTSGFLGYWEVGPIVAYSLMKPDKVLVVSLGGCQINALVLIILSGLAVLQGCFILG